MYEEYTDMGIVRNDIENPVVSECDPTKCSFYVIPLAAISW